MFTCIANVDWFVMCITDVTDSCAKNAKVITFIDNINIKISNWYRYIMFKYGQILIFYINLSCLFEVKEKNTHILEISSKFFSNFVRRVGICIFFYLCLDFSYVCKTYT